MPRVEPPVSFSDALHPWCEFRYVEPTFEFPGRWWAVPPHWQERALDRVVDLFKEYEFRAMFRRARGAHRSAADLWAEFARPRVPLLQPPPWRPWVSLHAGDVRVMETAEGRDDPRTLLVCVEIA